MLFRRLGFRSSGWVSWPSREKALRSLFLFLGLPLFIYLFIYRSLSKLNFQSYASHGVMTKWVNELVSCKNCVCVSTWIELSWSWSNTPLAFSSSSSAWSFKLPVQVHVHDLCDAAILWPPLRLATHSVVFVNPAHASCLTPNPDPFWPLLHVTVSIRSTVW